MCAEEIDRLLDDLRDKPICKKKPAAKKPKPKAKK
jgi:hypothetical protein